MIIPIKCMTCGKVLADKYIWYCDKVKREKILKGKDVNEIVYFKGNESKKSIEGLVLDELGLTKYCCRRIMLTHVDIE